MQTNHKLFDDLAKVANGAMEAMSGVKQEIENMVRHQVERIMGGMHMVTREEFDAVKAMAAKAREEQEAQAKRLTHVEQQVLDLLKDRAIYVAGRTDLDDTVKE